MLAGEVTPDANRAAWITDATAVLCRAGMGETAARNAATTLENGQ